MHKVKGERSNQESPSSVAGQTGMIAGLSPHTTWCTSPIATKLYLQEQMVYSDAPAAAVSVTGSSTMQHVYT